MNYNLNITGTVAEQKGASIGALREMLPILKDERLNLTIAIVAILINSTLTLVAPILVGHTIDTYIQTKQYSGVLLFSGYLFLLYLVTFFTSYIQTTRMGGVGQRTLFSLRNAIFKKLQDLPVAFFNQNKTGDLISRINNDTDKLNQFFSQSLMQFIGNLFMIVGAAIFIVSLNIKLGLAALSPAFFLLIFTQLTSAWIKRKNAVSLKATGGLSAEIQESLNNFKVIVAFNRRDYFRNRFQEANEENYRTSIRAGIANNIFVPIYGFCSNLATLVVLAYGISLIIAGDFTVGLLISFLTYVYRFYDPLRQIASLWSTFQTALAAWDRITAILSMDSDMDVIPSETVEKNAPMLAFKNVSFGYPDGKEVLHDISFSLESGKTYALVGPTGGGKTTTASLMARLYDPTKGTILLHGRDIRSYTAAERTQKIGFILQEPFLFTGTVRENILYGNDVLTMESTEELTAALEKANLSGLIARFENGLETKVLNSGDTMSLGQRQLIVFVRAVLRNPDLLILDEATANIDTVTEQLLEDILKKLPSSTTRVIIAHRLNTIENADEIFFVNAGTIVRAGSMQHAVDMLLHGKRQS
jgi:ATP-binding cassette subfamily B protein